MKQVQTPGKDIKCSFQMSLYTLVYELMRAEVGGELSVLPLTLREQ